MFSVSQAANTKPGLGAEGSSETKGTTLLWGL
jgi:hypothetical protein